MTPKASVVSMDPMIEASIDKHNTDIDKLKKLTEALKANVDEVQKTVADQSKASFISQSHMIPTPKKSFTKTDTIGSNVEAFEEVKEQVQANKIKISDFEQKMQTLLKRRASVVSKGSAEGTLVPGSTSGVEIEELMEIMDELKKSLREELANKADFDELKSFVN